MYIFILCFMFRPSCVKSSIVLCYNINKFTYLHIPGLYVKTRRHPQNSKYLITHRPTSPEDRSTATGNMRKNLVNDFRRYAGRQTDKQITDRQTDTVITILHSLPSQPVHVGPTSATRRKTQRFLTSCRRRAAERLFIDPTSELTSGRRRKPTWRRRRFSTSARRDTGRRVSKTSCRYRGAEY